MENGDNINNKENEKIELKEDVNEESIIEEKNASNEDANKEDVSNVYKKEVNVIPKEVIGIASDHRGYMVKQKLTKYLTKIGYTVLDYGTNTKDKADYPVYGFKLGKAIRDKKVSKGIAICGSGIGISMACNKVKGVRCAKVDNVSEAKYSRIDNDANAMAISAKMPMFRAKDIVDAFLKTEFSSLERHRKRIQMLDNYEED